MPTHSNHSFHLVDYMIRPMKMLSCMVKWFNKFDSNLLILGNIITLLTIHQWWRDVSRESTYQG